jgi:hypothetical protein
MDEEERNERIEYLTRLHQGMISEEAISVKIFVDKDEIKALRDFHTKKRDPISFYVSGDKNQGKTL